MGNSKIWLSSPHLGGGEMKYVQEAFDTNWVAPLGPNVNEFENELARFINTKHVAALSAGTGALHLAMVLLGIKAGDDVLCSTFTFSASANPITYVGAKPVFIDSESDTWNINPELLEMAIKERIKAGKKPKAIVLVHLYGMPAKIDEIVAIANKYEIPVVEDAAEALGSRYKGKACGTFGLMGILSFNGNKIITTSGGGALVSDNKELIDKARFLATQARDNAPHYQHSQIGFNYRMSNIVAGIGRGQLEVLDLRIKQRRDNFEWYKNLLVNKAGIKFLQAPTDDFFSNHWLTAITIDPNLSGGITREDIRLAFEKENIETRPLWKPMHLQPVFADCLNFTDGTSEKLFENGLCLPSGSNLNAEEKERIENVFLELKLI